MKLLVIEDDRATADFIVGGLNQRGYTVDLATDGLDGLLLASEDTYDVLIVDRMVPRLDGLSMVKTLRAQEIHTPVLFLSALGAIEDRVQGLEGGGDDYLVKPFAFAELHARVVALARRPPIAPQVVTVLRVRDVELDRVRRIVTRAGQEIALQPTELKILELLLERAGTIVTRTMLLEQIWGFHFDPKTSVVETHISRLRAKIDAGCDEGLIRTVRGAGYIVDETTTG